MWKSVLTQAPILSSLDWIKSFILQIDASAFGLGYVLSQINDLGEEHLVAFASKKLSPPEQNYSAIEREALGIVKGIEHYRTYLNGNPFAIHMDHNPLTHLANLKAAMRGWHYRPYLSNFISSRLNTEMVELTTKLTVSPESLIQQLRLGECQSHRRRTNHELIQM